MLKLLLLAVVLGTIQTQATDASPKKMMDHKINFGWPNFFNPEKGILREQEKRLKEKLSPKNKLRLKAEEEEEMEGHLSEEEEEEKEKGGDQFEEYDADDLIDYTLKGGLRGTLLLLNSTSDSVLGNLTEEAVRAMKDAEKEAEDGDGFLGEITEEGVHLRMPLVRMKYSPDLGKYGAQVTYYAKEDPVKFIYYGNWCGRGGRSAPVDELDRCCLEREKCYGRLIRQCPDVWKRPYPTMYAWTVLDAEITCLRSESFCVNHVCGCDREAALCFKSNLRAPQNFAAHVGTKAEVAKLDEVEQEEEVEETSKE